MNIAIVAATEMEIESLRKCSIESSHAVNFYTHGVGIMQATFYLQQIALTKPDFIIQCGVAGSYSDQLQLGETVFVSSECIGDSGAQDHEELLDLFDLNFIGKNTFPFIDGLLLNDFSIKIPQLKSVKGLTVNLGGGNERTIQQRINKYHCDIETMEGACLHYVCLMEKIPFIQLRGISNHVEPRDKSKWKIAEALQQCHKQVIQLIQQIS